MFVNTDPAIFSTLERKTKLCLVNTRVFPALYMQYIFRYGKIYIYNFAGNRWPLCNFMNRFEKVSHEDYCKIIWLNKLCLFTWKWDSSPLFLVKGILGEVFFWSLAPWEIFFKPSFDSIVETTKTIWFLLHFTSQHSSENQNQ